MFQVSSFMRSESTQPPLFYWFLEMENKFCCISTTTMSLLLLSVQYPDSVSRLSPLALTSPEWDSGFWMIKVVLSCCFLFNNLVYIELLLFSRHAPCPLCLPAPVLPEVLSVCLHFRRMTLKVSYVLAAH